MHRAFDVGAMVLLLGLVGCVAEIDQTTYLQNATVTAPFLQTPVHVTTSETRNSFTISPYVSTTTVGSMTGYVPSHTKVNSRGVFEVDTLRDAYGGVYLREAPGANVYPYRGENLLWSAQLPTVGVDVDLAWTSIALGLGLRYGVSDNASLYGGTFGFGVFDGGSTAGFRFEGGVVWQMSHYRATSVVVTTQSIYPFPGETTTLGIYDDEETKTRLSWYASMTLNTALDFPLNAFLQGSVSRQTLFAYVPRQHIAVPFLVIPVVEEQTQVTAAATVMVVSPGLFVRLGDRLRLLGGVRFPYVVSGDLGSDGQPLIPFVQLDFLLPREG